MESKTEKTKRDLLSNINDDTLKKIRAGHKNGRKIFFSSDVITGIELCKRWNITPHKLLEMECDGEIYPWKICERTSKDNLIIYISDGILQGASIHITTHGNKVIWNGGEIIFEKVDVLNIESKKTFLEELRENNVPQGYTVINDIVTASNRDTKAASLGKKRKHANKLITKITNSVMLACVICKEGKNVGFHGLKRKFWKKLMSLN